MVVTSRSVELRPRFRGTVIDGLAWHIEIGSNGTITGVSGPWTNLRTIATYPLRSVTAVFADLRAGRGIDPEPVATGAPAPAPGEAVPFHEIAPVTVTIDHVTLGAAVIPATDGRNAVVDIVPTYVFSGHAGADVIVSRTLVAVDANVTTPPGR
jgi:hypothetical protein